MDTNLDNTSILQTASASVEASTVENNETRSTSQESSAITTAAMENENQTATTALQLPTSSTSTTMSNITPTTSTATIIPPPTSTVTTISPPTSTAITIPPPIPSTSTTMSSITTMISAISTIPPPGRLGSRLPLELRLAIYIPLLCMTVAGRLPPILYALSGTSDYSILQAQYKIINFVLSDATLPVFSTITKRGNKLKKILYLHIRSDNFTFYGLNDNSRKLLVRHYCKLENSFRKITFTAIQPTRTPQTTESELYEANSNVDSILYQLCEIVIASVQAPQFRLKFLGYNNGNLIDQRKLNDFVDQVSRKLAVPGRIWTRRREMVGDDGVVHDGIVWIWELV
ncbi:uncharacterized protein Bfra_008222sa [Botrytis fragariae]|uniref:Uncharacterized protein n=1 Tax=Botrytis fragariae TaxID=1964551 RepID=A0A8H6AT65_9HELO|nr:uncharacterized protein Bfra_008222sa [Botrytis fragariae]KAF5872945.1 hypothetical protein Bfra_008222sa [Botrytis fragariae]